MPNLQIVPDQEEAPPSEVGEEEYEDFPEPHPWRLIAVVMAVILAFMAGLIIYARASAAQAEVPVTAPVEEVAPALSAPPPIVPVTRRSTDTVGLEMDELRTRMRADKARFKELRREYRRLRRAERRRAAAYD